MDSLTTLQTICTNSKTLVLDQKIGQFVNIINWKLRILGNILIIEIINKFLFTFAGILFVLYYFRGRIKRQLFINNKL